jgi:Right handed beta helix region
MSQSSKRRTWWRLGALAVLTAAIVVLALSLGAADEEASKASSRAVSCDRTLAPGAGLGPALARAEPGSTICLRAGRYRGAPIEASATDKDAYVTVRSVPGKKVTIVGELAFDHARHIRLQGLKLAGGVAFVPAATHVQLIDNEITGSAGIFLFGDDRVGGATRSVLIEGNFIHDIDYRGDQGTYDGYGIKSIGAQRNVTVRGNTIKSVAADYIQTDQANEWIVDRNRFLGPSLAGTHPQEHQDLWQVYAGGVDLAFTNNVARRTGTSQSLLFQMTYPGDRFARVRVVGNLFDHDSLGYTCQIYQADGLLFRANTIVGSRWGCLFRDEAGLPGGSRYRVVRNIFAETSDGAGVGFEGRAGEWGRLDYNVSTDDSAPGKSSLRNWRAVWENEVHYQPLRLPFRAGYRAAGS